MTSLSLNWMTSNMLKLNGDKSDIMVLNDPRRPRIELPPITICDESVSKSDSTTLLGVEVDSTLSLKNHVKNTTKCCFHKLYKLIQNQRISIRRRCENDGPHFDYLQGRLLQFNFKRSTQYHPGVSSTCTEGSGKIDIK